MLKGFLIAMAALVSFDAVALHSSIRIEVARELGIAFTEIGELSWAWD